MNVEQKSIFGTTLAKIIEVCGQNGVAQIKIGDIEITFSGYVASQSPNFPEKVNRIEENPSVDPNFEFEDRADNVSREADIMMIEDPLAYEESLARGDELEDYGNS